MSKGIHKCQSFDIVWSTTERHHDAVGVRLSHRDPACHTQQLVRPLAPMAQLGSLDGVAAQVQKHLGALAEALAGKGAGSVRNAHAVGEEHPSGRLARIVSEQLDLQYVRVAGGAELSRASSP